MIIIAADIAIMVPNTNYTIQYKHIPAMLFKIFLALSTGAGS
jgi:hypothetical protein